MAVGLRFTDGTTTVTVSNGSTGILESYQQNNAPDGIQQVTDKAGFILLGTLATVRTTVQSLNRLFWAAAERKRTGMGARVFVERDLGDAVWWRSEIIEATLVNRAETLDTGLAGEKVPFDCAITRLNWWEGAEASVPLTNGSATDNTSGITIYNHDDSGTNHDNWVTIDGVNDVSGDLPAPTKITISDVGYTNPAPTYVRSLWVGQTWTTTSIAAMLEAESSSGGSDTTDSTCSGGKRRDYAVSAGTESEVTTWPLSDTVLNYYRGMYVMPILRLAATTNVSKLRFKLALSYLLDVAVTSVTFYTSDYVQPATDVHIVELPSFRLPPYLLSQTNYNQIDLRLSIKNTHTSSVTAQVDFIQMTPMQGWCKYALLDQVAGGPASLIDDGINGLLQLQIGGSAYKIANVVRYGEAIKLLPGVDQKLFFLHRDSAVASIDRTLTVKAVYRPRKLTI